MPERQSHLSMVPSNSAAATPGQSGSIRLGVGSREGEGPGKPLLLAQSRCGGGREAPVAGLPIVSEVLGSHLDAVPGVGPHSPEGEGRGFDGPHLREKDGVSGWPGWEGHCPAACVPEPQSSRSILHHSPSQSPLPQVFGLCGPDLCGFPAGPRANSFRSPSWTTPRDGPVSRDVSVVRSLTPRPLPLPPCTSSWL